MRSAGRRPAGSRTSAPSASPRASPTPSRQTQWSSSGSSGRWPPESLLVDPIDGRMRELGASAGQWRPPAPITHHDRRDDRSSGLAAVPPSSSCRSGGRPPMGNPAAGLLVTYLSSVVLVSGCCLPGQAGSPCTPPPPSIGRPKPPAPRRVPVAPALTGCPPASWAAAAQRGRDARHPRATPRQGRHHRQCRSGTGVQRDPNQASQVANRCS
jgi:hypothetical protein